MPIIAYIVSLGCAKNLVDTEVMCGALVANGCLLAENENDANVMLITPAASFWTRGRKRRRPSRPR
ncbi:MAG: hypothetical protein IKN52_05980 [Victivallales bacterium]|nr:hypothetical protein [Victivallales bacterium]